MAEFIKYPSIEQFRNICKQVKHSAEYVSYDASNRKANIDYTISKPTLTFIGTVKIHGTNAAVCYDLDTGELYAQSRNNIITVDSDNNGFALFVENNRDTFKRIVTNYTDAYEITSGVITLFGEWCGGNIQKGVAVNGLSKMFVIFDVKINEEWFPVYTSYHFESVDDNIYSIHRFGNYTIDVDFNNPERSVNEIAALTLKVEEECPVGKYFGVQGVGEGIVWRSSYKGDRLVFKVKGEKHSVSKVKTLSAVDVEKLNSVQEFVEYAVTDNRMLQAIEQVFTMNNIEPSIEMLGSFLKWIMNDIIKEEMDVLTANKLEPKDISKEVNNKARKWFKENYNV